MNMIYIVQKEKTMITRENVNSIKKNRKKRRISVSNYRHSWCLRVFFREVQYYCARRCHSNSQ
jgi:hypothetical protein